ncbi:hypothetical protein [Actinomadura verrucosospora]|uniref:Uncharacterized protein n=1 Tax=Actinomadura verrucosospora TaxID=46165 RepID=A0A7D4A6X9_ACTVE|nr:hypothetical protein [Actinomadura verrucosospora]QKG24065.1 hypothetical protein ACTIVE_5708 [Actinomadura verrucosospora]
MSDDARPWVITWRFNTGYSGVDRFKDADRAVIFCDELFKRLDPPILEMASFLARNEKTGETLGNYLQRQQELSAKASSVESRLGSVDATGDTTCGTCGGSGEIPIIQTGRTKKCTRCDGTGKE